MSVEAKIRILDVQVAVPCVQPNSPIFSKRIVAEGTALDDSLLQTAKDHEEEELEKSYFQGEHLGTIIEHADHPATIDEVTLYPKDAVELLRIE